MTFRLEKLTSTKVDGGWHARYPTATLTLCGLEVGPMRRGRPYPPDCGKCALVARRFDRIDGAMPDNWRPDSGQCAGTSQASGERCERPARQAA